VIVHAIRLKRLSLEDRLEIHDLVVGYSTFLDLQQFDELPRLFLGAGVLELPETKLRGAEQIGTYFQTASAQSAHQGRLHHADSIWVCSHDWDCVVRSHYFETGRSPETGGQALLVSGVFEDLIVHCNDGWKFSSRKFTGNR
jgi:hypothetical protein